jgi:hypothetical protein
MRAVICCLMGLWNRPRTASFHCAAVSTGLSLVSISLLGPAASALSLACCAGQDRQSLQRMAHGFALHRVAFRCGRRDVPRWCG